MNENATSGNIGPKQRITRIAFGIILLIAFIVFAIYSFTNEMSRWWYFLHFFLFYNALLFIEEYRRSICPVNALRGKRSMEGYFSLGKEPIDDPDLVSKFKKSAIKMILSVTVWSIIITVVFYLIDYYI